MLSNANILINIFVNVAMITPPECNNGTYGFNCEGTCKTCQNTSCERFKGNCTDGCIKDFEGHQCQFSG
jgi:hypothetical protein